MTSDGERMDGVLVDFFCNCLDSLSLRLFTE